MGLASKLLSSPFGSLASTCAPSPSPEAQRPRLSSPDSVTWGYLALPEPASTDEERLSSASEEPLSAALRPRRWARALIAAGAAVMLSAFAVAAGCLSEKGEETPAPRIWNPDLRAEFRTEPYAKSVIRKFDGYNMARGGLDDAATFRANVELYMDPGLLYESVGFGTWRTPAGWARGEEHNYGMAFPETIFTQMLFFGDASVATTTTYGSALWHGDLFGVKAPKQWVTLRITDFYLMKEGRISYNFMMIDWADALRQIGRPLLPKAPLPEGLVLPPAANDGVPAPLSAVVQSQGRNATEARRVALSALEQDWAGDEASAAKSWPDDMTFYGPGGVGLARGAAAYRQHVLAPFRAAFANRTAEVELSACEGNYCAALGRLHCHGVAPWVGLPTAGRDIALRFAMHWRVVGGKVQEGWAIFDMPGLFQQVGKDFYALAAAAGPRA